MASNSQAMRLGYLLSPHIAFQGHAAHTARWPAMLSPNGSSGTCIPDGVYHIPMPCLHGATMPPVRPVRETFASYGSRQRDITGKVHFASSTVHSPWTALRVRWVPVYCFPTLSLRAFAMCAVFPHSDYYALFDCLQGLGVSLGSRLPTVHPPSHPFQALPCSQHRTQSRML
jgi:hypothetical protein